MICFKFEINWPWASREVETKRYLTKYWKVSKNKSIELEFTRWDAVDSIFSIWLDTRWVGRDHGGLNIDITVWRWYFNFSFYDMRHWDYDEHRWQTYEEANAEE